MSASDSDLSYAFARDKGLVVLAAQDGAIQLGARNGVDPFSLIEARRDGTTVFYSPLRQGRP